MKKSSLKSCQVQRGPVHGFCLFWKLWHWCARPQMRTEPLALMQRGPAVSTRIAPPLLYLRQHAEVHHVTPRRGLHSFSHHTLMVWCTALWCWGNFCVTANFLYLWVATKNSVEMIPAPRARPGRRCFLRWQYSKHLCLTDALITSPCVSLNIAHLENEVRIWREPIPRWPPRWKWDVGNFHHFHHWGLPLNTTDYEKKDNYSQMKQYWTSLHSQT